MRCIIPAALLAVVADASFRPHSDAFTWQGGKLPGGDSPSTVDAPPPTRQEGADETLYWYMSPSTQGVMGPHSARDLVAWGRSGALPSSTLVSRCRSMADSPHTGLPSSEFEDEDGAPAHWITLAQLGLLAPPQQEPFISEDEVSVPAQPKVISCGAPRLTEWFEDGADPPLDDSDSAFACKGADPSPDDSDSAFSTSSHAEERSVGFDVKAAEYPFPPRADTAAVGPPPNVADTFEESTCDGGAGLPTGDIVPDSAPERAPDSAKEEKADESDEDAPRARWWQAVINEVAALPPEAAREHDVLAAQAVPNLKVNSTRNVGAMAVLTPDEGAEGTSLTPPKELDLDAEYGSLVSRASKITQRTSVGQRLSPPSAPTPKPDASGLNGEFRSLMSAAAALCDARREKALRAEKQSSVENEVALTAAEEVSKAISIAYAETLEAGRIGMEADSVPEMPVTADEEATPLSNDDGAVESLPPSNEVTTITKAGTLPPLQGEFNDAQTPANRGKGESDYSSNLNSAAKNDTARHEGSGYQDTEASTNKTTTSSTNFAVPSVLTVEKTIHVTSQHISSDSCTQRDSVAYSFTSPQVAASLTSTASTTVLSDDPGANKPDANGGAAPTNNYSREREEETGVPIGDRFEEWHQGDASGSNSQPHQSLHNENRYPSQSSILGARDVKPDLEVPGESSSANFEAQSGQQPGTPRVLNAYWPQSGTVEPYQRPEEQYYYEHQPHPQQQPPPQSGSTYGSWPDVGDSARPRRGIFSGITSGLMSSSTGLAERLVRARVTQRISQAAQAAYSSISPSQVAEPSQSKPSLMQSPSYDLSAASTTPYPPFGSQSPPSSISSGPPMADSDDTTAEGTPTVMQQEETTNDVMSDFAAPPQQQLSKLSDFINLSDGNAERHDTPPPEVFPSMQFSDIEDDSSSFQYMAKESGTPLESPLTPPPLPLPQPPPPSTLDPSSFVTMPSPESGGAVRRAHRITRRVKRAVISPLVRTLPLMRTLRHSSAPVCLAMRAAPISTTIYPVAVAIRAAMVPMGLLLVAISLTSFADSLVSSPSGLKALYPLRAAALAAATAARENMGAHDGGPVPLVDLSHLILDPSGLLDEMLGPHVLGRFLNIFTGDPNTSDGLAIGPVLEPIQRTLSPLFRYLANASPWQAGLPPSLVSFPGQDEPQSDLLSQSPTSAALLPLVGTLSRPLCVIFLVVVLRYLIASIESGAISRIQRHTSSAASKTLTEIRLRCAARLATEAASQQHGDNEDEAQISEVCDAIDNNLDHIAEFPAAHVRALGAVIASAAGAGATFVASAWLFTALADPSSSLHDSKGLFGSSGLFVEGMQGLRSAARSSAKALGTTSSQHASTLTNLLNALLDKSQAVPWALFDDIANVWPALLCVAWVVTAVVEGYLDFTLLGSNDSIATTSDSPASRGCERQVLLSHTGTTEEVEAHLRDAPQRLLPHALREPRAQSSDAAPKQHARNEGPLKAMLHCVLKVHAIVKLCVVLIWRTLLRAALFCADAAVYLLLAHGALCYVLANLASSSTGPPILSGGADPLTGDLLKRLVVLSVTTIVLLYGHGAVRSAAQSVRGLNAAAAHSSIYSDALSVRARLPAVKSRPTDGATGNVLPPAGPLPADGLRLEDVWVAYGGEGAMAGSPPEAAAPHYAIRGLTLHAPANSIVVVLGLSGAGKSSLLEAIARATTSARGGAMPHSPFLSHGQVVLQGRPRGEWGSLAWANQLAVLRQNPARFRMTVAENVAMGAFGGSSGEARDEAVREALRLAGAADLEHSLPAGLRTLLVEDSAAELHGKASASLSAREWSAVARARALSAFNTSRLILMDEPTEGMNDKDEQEFMAKLRYVVDNAPHGPVVVIASQHVRLCDALFANVVTLLGPGGVPIEQTQLMGASEREL